LTGTFLNSGYLTPIFVLQQLRVLNVSATQLFIYNVSVLKPALNHVQLSVLCSRPVINHYCIKLGLSIYTRSFISTSSNYLPLLGKAHAHTFKKYQTVNGPDLSIREKIYRLVSWSKFSETIRKT